MTQATRSEQALDGLTIERFMLSDDENYMFDAEVVSALVRCHPRHISHARGCLLRVELHPIIRAYLDRKTALMTRVTKDPVWKERFAQDAFRENVARTVARLADYVLPEWNRSVASMPFNGSSGQQLMA